jgi:hypothetical protein
MMNNHFELEQRMSEIKIAVEKTAREAWKLEPVTRHKRKANVLKGKLNEVVMKVKEIKKLLSPIHKNIKRKS